MSVTLEEAGEALEILIHTLHVADGAAAQKREHHEPHHTLDRRQAVGGRSGGDQGMYSTRPRGARRARSTSRRTAWSTMRLPQPARRSPRGGPPRWPPARHRALRPTSVARLHVDDLAALVKAEHGKVMADAAGEVARGLEVVEFACGSPAAQGRVQRGRPPPASTSTPSGSRWVSWRASPRSTSRSWSLLDVPVGDRLRQHVRAETFGERSVRLAPPGRAGGRGGISRRGVQRGAGRQGSGGPDPDAPGHRGGELRRVDAGGSARL